MIGLLIIGSALSGFMLAPKLFHRPTEWPKPVYNFENNILEAAKVELGRQLFYDPVLSRDSTISCASCHLQYTAFTHVDHDLSHGIEGRIGRRNSPALMNLAWSPYFMWDGAINHLDVQPLAPIHDANEMDETIEHVVAKLQRSQNYVKAFDTAWKDTLITGEHVLKSLSQFLVTLVSANSKYDQVMSGHEGISFTSQENNGLQIFRAHCESCHAEPLFTTFEFASTGLDLDTTLNDLGRYEITGNSFDSLAFKIPTLRNIEFSKPYMHDGRFSSLNEVIAHYNQGVSETANPDSRIKPQLHLSHEDQVDLLAFLLTLTDKEFLFEPDFGFPRRN